MRDLGAAPYSAGRAPCSTSTSDPQAVVDALRQRPCSRATGRRVPVPARSPAMSMATSSAVARESSVSRCRCPAPRTLAARLGGAPRRGARATGGHRHARCFPTAGAPWAGRGPPTELGMPLFPPAAAAIHRPGAAHLADGGLTIDAGARRRAETERRPARATRCRPLDGRVHRHARAFAIPMRFSPVTLASGTRWRRSGTTGRPAGPSRRSPSGGAHTRAYALQHLWASLCPGATNGAAKTAAPERTRGHDPCTRSSTSPLGELLLVGDGHALHGPPHARGAPTRRRQARLVAAREEPFAAAREQLEEYFRRPAFAVRRPAGDVRQPLRAPGLGVPCRTIPYGPHDELRRRRARAIGAPRRAASRRASRTVANPIAVIVPCHRVIGRRRGALPGTAAVWSAKRLLLDLEAGVLTLAVS